MIITKENDTEKFAMIERWQQSKQTISQFCVEENIATHVFYYWHAKYRKQNNKPGAFIKIAPPVISHTKPNYCTIHFTNGIRLVFNEQPNASFIKQLL
ncbi:IS66 family insertion sequence element accessory protein TnpA [Flavobacterium sp.]|uniref:IS66 family insertion sequence element accessory protein TnpA n=1 Tax=Flavobacterium sp. TaxID=239 RepID=UPI002B4AEF42|nr:hypothetical protein [Flavobacterium sp.]HLF51557.1 hypothetical protein [Flavobacterium sp.]